MKRSVAAIWGGTLVVAFGGAVPVAVYFLNRTLNAARQIEQYTVEIREAAEGIARNTAHTSALKDTIPVAIRLDEAAASLEQHTTTIRTVLAPEPSEDGQGEDEE